MAIQRLDVKHTAYQQLRGEQMKMIYIDSEYKCYVSPGEGRTAVETEYFDGKCDEYIEGYRYIPAGQSWTRWDGVVFMGEMMSPWQDSGRLDSVQMEYERALLAEYRTALETLGVEA